MSQCSKLVGVMMAKNEEDRILSDTMASIAPYCSEFVLLDTGSTDNTIDVIRDFCKKNSIKFHLKQEEFINFRDSRNHMLDFVDELYKDDPKFLLLLDAHDELRNGKTLVKFVNSFNKESTGFYITQQWKSDNSFDSYQNVRLIKSNNTWRYNGVVHEYIARTDKKADQIMRVSDVTLFQDRTKDDDKSMKRFTRDKKLLYDSHIEDPTEPRTLFYLAQTCACLGQLQEAYKYYILRLKAGGFIEEVYQCYYRLGDLSVSIGHDWDESLLWYHKAFQHSQRAEPLVKIAHYYLDNSLYNDKKSEWHTAFMYASMACMLVYPVHHILFINKQDYTYRRWHILSIAAFYVGRNREGKDASIKAIEAENKQVDRQNLKFFMEREINIKSGNETLTCLNNVSATFLATDLRSKEEVVQNHPKEKIIPELLDEVIKGRAEKNTPVPGKLVKELKEIYNIKNDNGDQRKRKGKKH